VVREPALPREVAEGLEPGAILLALGAGAALLGALRPGPAGGAVLSLGDHETVVRLTRQSLIDAVKGYAEEDCLLTRPDMRAILRDRALSRGIFIVRGDGVLASTGREAHPIAGLVPEFDASDPESLAAALSRATRAAFVTASRARDRVALFARGQEIPLS